MQVFSCHASLTYSIWLCREYRTHLTATWVGQAIPTLSQEGSRTHGAARESSLLRHQTQHTGEAGVPWVSRAALLISAGKGMCSQGLCPWTQGIPSPLHPQTRQPRAFRLSSLWGTAG